MDAAIINGSFETGDFTGWTVSPDPSTTNGNTAIVDATLDLSRLIYVHDGFHSAFFSRPPSTGINMSQTVANLIPGQHYTLDFFFKDGGSTEPTTKELKVSWDGDAVLDITNFSSRNVWFEETIDVVASSTSAPLSFLINPNGDIILDQITLNTNDVTPLSTPEPMSMAIWATFIGAACYSVRRRRGQPWGRHSCLPPGC